MHTVLKAHIEKLLGTYSINYNGIEQYLVPVQLRKKQNLLVEGKICLANYFVVKGCLRMFFVNDKGVEQTIQFALENWWLADYTSFSAQKPSEFYIQAVEDSEVLCLPYSVQDDLFSQVPQLERYFRLVHQRAHAAAQFRIKSLYGSSREILYHEFVRRYPEFVQRIPQYLLASFLGFTPEYLSELRKKSIS